MSCVSLLDLNQYAEKQPADKSGISAGAACELKHHRFGIFCFAEGKKFSKGEQGCWSVHENREGGLSCSLRWMIWAVLQLRDERGMTTVVRAAGWDWPNLSFTLLMLSPAEITIYFQETVRTCEQNYLTIYINPINTKVMTYISSVN